MATLTSSALQNWKRIQWQWVSLAAGLTLAATAVLAVNSSDSSSGRVQAPVPMARVMRAPQVSSDWSMVLYLVSDEAEMDRMLAKYHEVAAADGTVVVAEMSCCVRVLLVRTLQEELEARVTIDEAVAVARAGLQHGGFLRRFDVVDLR
jgi:hypothetical protein